MMSDPKEGISGEIYDQYDDGRPNWTYFYKGCRVRLAEAENGEFVAVLRLEDGRIWSAVNQSTEDDQRRNVKRLIDAEYKDSK